jgi:hypothetical protein
MNATTEPPELEVLSTTAEGCRFILGALRTSEQGVQDAARAALDDEEDVGRVHLLDAIAVHCELTLGELDVVAPGVVGAADVRGSFGEQLLLGLGIVERLRRVARPLRDDRLVSYCCGWLDQRAPLVAAWSDAMARRAAAGASP